MAEGTFDVTYSGEGGFDTTQPVNDGMSAKADVVRTKAVALAAHGVVVAVNAPKLALSLSTESFLEAAAERDPKALGGADLADELEKQLGQFYTPTSPSSDFFRLSRAAYVMWVTSVAYAGPGSVSMLPCQQFYETFVASAGVDKKLLGTSIAAPPAGGVEVFKGGKTVVDAGHSGLPAEVGVSSAHGDSRSIRQLPASRWYRTRSCSRLSRPCQNSSASGLRR